MRYFSYVFHGLLALFLIAVSTLAVATDPQALSLPMLPFKGSTLTYVVLFSAIFGLITILLAIGRRVPVLFFAWSVVVFVMMVKGYLFSGYRFVNGSVGTAVWLTLFAAVALVGAWFGWRSPAAGKAKY
jgi:hypothetical protein